MEKYSLTTRTEKNAFTMHFLYINEKVHTGQWEEEVYHEYHKINIFLNVDARIIKGEHKYDIKNTGILYYSPFESHYGRPNYVQQAEYFEFLIPRQFFSFVDGGVIYPAMLCKNSDLFTMETKNYRKLTEKLFLLRQRFKNREAEIYILSEVISILEYLEQNQVPLKGAPIRKHISNPLLEILSFIDSHYKEINSINEIAKSLHISVSYICRLFKNELSTTPYKYITEKKLEYAKELLQKNYSVTQAAMDSNFYSTSAFIQIFKKNYGITPNEYKKLYLKN